MFPGATVLQHSQNVVMGPGQLLQLHQPVMRIHPDELVGAGHVGVDGLQAGMPHQPPYGWLRAFGAAQGGVSRRGLVGAHRKLLNRQLDVL